MLRASARSRCLAGFAGLLLAAGCSGGGGHERPAPSCTKWTPGAATGPGDVARHFPLEPGSRWIVHTSGPPEAWDSHEVTGTRAVLGYEAAVMAGFDLDTRAPYGEVYRAVDDHGVLDLGNDDPEDWLSDTLVPYYYARFPLAVGDAFTSVECSNLDYGEDLDGDGQNEFLDVRVASTVAAVEPIATPIASFPDAARVEQRLTLTVRASGSPQQATAEGRITDWVVPGVGPVREIAELPVGSPSPAVEVVGWDVGDVARGLLARRQIASGVTGPYAAAFDGARFLVAGRGASSSGTVRVTAIPVTPGGDAGAPFDLFLVSRDSPLEISPPALAAAGGVVAALASTWYSGGDVLLQRVTAAGALLEDPAGRVIAPAVSHWAYGCGPALASDGTGFLGVWMAPEGGLRLARIGADGTVVVNPALLDPPSLAGWWPHQCPVVAFDGTRHLVVYEWTDPSDLTGSASELRAVHVGADGVVAESAPLVLSSTPGIKHPIAMVFDGARHVLLLADGRDGASTALTLRRLSPDAGWLDGDAATGGLVLESSWAAMNHASLYGESITLDGATPVVAWATGVNTLPVVPDDEAWVMRLGPDGAPLDLHAGLPGIDAYLGDPASCGGVSFPLALGGADGVPEVLYSVACGYPANTQSLRAVRFGL